MAEFGSWSPWSPTPQEMADLPPPDRGINLLDRAPPQGEMWSYEPTWRDRVAQWITGDRRPTPVQYHFLSRILGSAGAGSTGNLNAVDLTPAGIPFTVDETLRAA